MEMAVGITKANLFRIKLKMKMANTIRTCIIGTLLSMSFALHAQSITFSTPGGFYEQTLHLALSCDNQEAIIHYTTNGNLPTGNDAAYDSPLLLDEQMYSKSSIYTILNCPEDEFYLPHSVPKCIVIRAAAFDAGGNRIGEVSTNSYFIRSIGCDTHGLPAVSICADSLDLFDYERGILVPGATFNPSQPGATGNYYQTGREWERLTNFEFYEQDNTGINQVAGLRTHGGNGRKLQQKSLKLYARDEYGKKRFDYPFFENLPLDSFKHLVLKPFCATWFIAGANNHISNQIATPLNLETLASRPVALFLNGEYWGIYFLQEKPDEHYLEDHCHVDKDDVNLIEGWRGDCEAGSNHNFMALYDFIANHDLSDSSDYAFVAGQIDIGNFIDYQIVEIFTANLDWPANNMRCWQEGNGPWRWIFFDGDICLIQKEFDAFANATYDGPGGYPSNALSTLFLRKLLQNETFKLNFINRFNQLMHGPFAYETTKPFLDEALETLRGEIPNQVARFGFPDNLQNWKNHMAGINTFLELRANFVAEQLHEHFLSDNCSLIDALFPMPAQSEIHIQTLFDNTASTPIQIFDLTGNLQYCQHHVFGKGQSETVLPLHLPSGVYILRIGGKTKKFVVVN